MDFISSLTWADLLVVLFLAVGAFGGFTQGIAHYAVGCLTVVVAFILAALAKGPVAGGLGFWNAYNVETREVIVFLFLYLVAVVGFWFLLRPLLRGTVLPVPRVVNEVLGALFGIVYAALVLVFLVAALGSLYGQPGAVGTPAPGEGGEAAALGSLYVGMDGSLMLDALRAVIIPTAGWVAWFVVPEDVKPILSGG